MRHSIKSTALTKIIFLAAVAGVCLVRPGPAFSAGAEFQTHTNSLGLEFVLIPAGSFTMGSENKDRPAKEKPAHKVRLSRPFYLGKFQVTQEQWEAVMDTNPSAFRFPNHPVEQVAWDEVQEFIKRLNEKEGHQRYRLPTEAEWEYAARAGTNTEWSFGKDSLRIDDYAWYIENSGETTHPVGQKQPNAWGLYDTGGNAFEWVADWYDPDYYSVSPAVDPAGPPTGGSRVIKGGCWTCQPVGVRPANRNGLAPNERSSSLTFRLALSPE